MTDQGEEATTGTARRFAAAAGIDIPDGRLALFANSLERNQELTRTVLTKDYGDIEPASRFRAPAPSP